MKESRPKPKSNPRAGSEQSKEDQAREQRRLDEALEETFPASDPPAQVQPHDRSPGSRDDPHKRPEEKKKHD